MEPKRKYVENQPRIYYNVTISKKRKGGNWQYIDQYINAMNTNSPQKEMQQIIRTSIADRSWQLASECLDIYLKTFGYDDFYTEHALTLICENGPSVTLICIQCDSDYIDDFVIQQQYKNLDVIDISSADCENDILSCIQSAHSKYVSFLEPNHKYNAAKLSTMVFMAESRPELDGMLCTRNFIDTDDTIIAPPDGIQNLLHDKTVIGQRILEWSILNNINLYGNLSTLLLSTEYMKQVAFSSSQIPSSMHRMALLHQLLFHAKIYCANLPLVSTILKPYDNPSGLETDYKNYLKVFFSNHNVEVPDIENIGKTCQDNHIPVQKNITFFYTDKGEYYNLKPIADEAEKRGYEISFTEKIKQKAEIGVYCQHTCHPENSKFSVILLHDLAQGHLRWPNIWDWERWNNFDIGILPSKSWAERWSQCACQYYANPRCGTFDLGYPKSDLIHSETLKNRAETLRQQFGLKHDISILYAPSWENDGKEHDFITSLSSLDVNLLIKQAHLPEEPETLPIIENIRQMRALHEGKYPNVYYIEPEESIQTALFLCDYVVSDESSVMSEAVMFGKLSIAVTDWLIPDTKPSRYACFPLDYVIKCRKSQLQETVSNLLASPEKYSDILEEGRQEFSSCSGHVCKDIVDAIEFYTMPETERNPSLFQHKKLTSKYSPCSMWN